MPRKKSLLLAVLVVAVFFGIWLVQDRAEENVRKSSVTAFSRQATGMSVFYELVKNTAEDKSAAVILGQKSHLTDGALDDIRTVALFSPLFGIKRRERNLLLEFVGRGGHLLLSFHDAASFGRIKALTKPFGLTLKSQDDEDFKNRATVTAVSNLTDDVFAAGETYEFYSPLLMVGPACDARSFACYVFTAPYEDGAVTVIAGIPPLSNALIGKSDNAKIAFRLIGAGTPLLINEYVHGFTNRSFWDLMKLPEFALPFCGMLALVLLYYLFAHTPFHVSSLALPERTPSISYHHVSEDMMAELVRKPEAYGRAVREHVRLLTRLFPRDRERITRKAVTLLEGPGARWDEKTFLGVAGELIELHKDILKTHGRKIT